LRKTTIDTAKQIRRFVSLDGPEIRSVNQRGIPVILCAIFISVLAGCASPTDTGTRTHFDLQGHRGARGLAPENTIPGFIRALELGVTTLELDAVIGGDGEVVVSHEPWFSSQICSHPDGRPVNEDEERDLKIFEMSYDQIERFDCGSRGNTGFPEQRVINVAKPLLTDVIRTVEAHVISEEGRRVYYNIEIKSTPERDGVYYSTVTEYAQLLVDVLNEQDILSFTSIQSFDPRALEVVKTIDPTISLVFLVDNDIGFSKNLDRLSFAPDIYSPHHRLVDKTLVEEVHRMDIKVIPWTVNEGERMKELIDAGVDGFITDYPDRGVAFLATLSE